MAHKRSFCEHAKAEALETLRLNGGRLRETARQLGIGHTTLYQWTQRGVGEDVEEQRPAARAFLADRFENVAHELLDGVTPEKIAAANVQQVLTSSGIAVDKMRLLREQPTAISAQLTEEQRRERIARLLEVEPEQLPDRVGELGSAYDAGNTHQSGD